MNRPYDGTFTIRELKEAAIEAGYEQDRIDKLCFDIIKCNERSHSSEKITNFDVLKYDMAALTEALFLVFPERMGTIN